MSDEKSDSDRTSTFHGRCRAAFVGAVLGVVSVSLLILGGFAYALPARIALGYFVFGFGTGLIPIPASILGATLGIWYQTRIEQSKDKLQSFVLVFVTGVAILFVAWLALGIEW